MSDSISFHKFSKRWFSFQKTKKMKKIFFTIVLLIVSCNSKETTDKSSKNGEIVGNIETNPVFEKVKSEVSHLQFANTITENLETMENLFSFDYFYNGAGVGVEDLNNDGLLDVFFCGNQVDNKLYLNKGNLVFEDITLTSGINTGKQWSNGVTFVDINNDGYKDIYISQGGPNQRENRKNLLFINNQDLTFTEKAEEYGIADMGLSTQSAFLDYDNDGDLDCVVMNENEIYGVDPINFYKMIGKSNEVDYFNSSHIYKNEDGKYVDVTETAGLQTPIFGLGLCISDINKDGFLDIYMASDYYIPDALYINNGNGTFTDRIKEYTHQIPHYGMGVDIADINSDLMDDIFVLDMSSSDHVRSKTLMASMNTARFDYLTVTAGFHYQYMYNSLQLNLGHNKFNNIAQLTHTANTDWSWSVLMSDFDNDEDNDIYITNGYRRYGKDNDLQNKIYTAKQKFGKNVPLEVKRQLYESMPSEKLQNMLFQNEGALEFSEKAANWGLGDFTFSNGAVQGDLDNDGDLDLIVNNMDENTFLYKNMTVEKNAGNYLKIKTKGETSEPYCTVKITYGDKSQQVEQKRVRGYMSAQDTDIHFGVGNNSKIDTVIINWLNGKSQEFYNVNANTTLVADIQNAEQSTKKSKKVNPYFKEINPSKLGLDYIHKENNFDDFATEILLPYKQSTFGPFVSKGDVNGDGKEDLYIGGGTNQPGSIFLQTENNFKKIVPKAFIDDAYFEDMESVLFDFDGDEDLDLYVVSGGNQYDDNSSYYQDRIYLNDGKGNFIKHDEAALQSFSKNGKAVSVIDYDKDGDLDILVGNRSIPQKYPQHSPSTIYENKGGVLENVTQKIAPELESFGIINSILTTDFDNDGWNDFIAVGEWTSIGFFKNHGGTFKLVQDVDAFNEKGWWFSVEETDINNDGLKDYVVGNVGLNLKFKASDKKPFKIYSNDFDNNGINDVVLSKQYKGEYVPVRGRECSSQQMPFIKDKFKSYSSFANATLVDIYGEKLETSYEKETTQFQSLILVNKGNGKYESKPLPILSQQFPIMNIAFYDVNDDGYEDCIVAGNIFDTEVETPRLDAVSGVVLLSNKKDGYKAMDYKKSGIYLEKDTKDIIMVNFDNHPLLISTNNDNNLISYELTSN